MLIIFAVVAFLFIIMMDSFGRNPEGAGPELFEKDGYGEAEGDKITVDADGNRWVNVGKTWERDMPSDLPVDESVSF